MLMYQGVVTKATGYSICLVASVAMLMFGLAFAAGAVVVLSVCGTSTFSQHQYVSRVVGLPAKGHPLGSQQSLAHGGRNNVINNRASCDVPAIQFVNCC